MEVVCGRVWRQGLVPLRSRGIATLIDGKQIANGVLKEVRSGVEDLKRVCGQTPGLGMVLVGSRPDSETYVRRKGEAAKKVGVRSIQRNLPESVSQQEVLQVVEELNSSKDVDGVLVQLPLPPQCDQAEILHSISVTKDVDGFHPMNVGNLARSGEELRQHKQKFDPLRARNVPCTPLGVAVLLDRSGVDVSGKRAVVLGRSNLVGLPLSLILTHRDATVTLCHSHTPNLEEVCREADILVAAMGKAEMVKGSWIKPGATVVDVGINFGNDPSHKTGKRMCGDVDFEAAKRVAGLLTPVPGGVGPMTVAMLLVNTLNNAKTRLES